MNLLKKYLLNLGIQKKDSPDNLIQKHKTEGIRRKVIRNYQNPVKLVNDLRDGNINPIEVLKDQINFKLDLREIKTFQRLLSFTIKG